MPQTKMGVELNFRRKIKFEYQNINIYYTSFCPKKKYIILVTSLSDGHWPALVDWGNNIVKNLGLKGTIVIECVWKGII